MTPAQLNHWLAIQRYEKPNARHIIIGPHVCPDGFKVSIQASAGHYCSPRSNNLASYGSVELGYPNQIEPELLQYAENPERPLDTVYAYVPVELVASILTKHGA